MAESEITSMLPMLRQADLLLNKGLVEEAVEFYIRIIGMAPHQMDAYARLGHAYHLIGSIKEAAAAYLKVLSFEDVDAGTYCGIADFIRTGERLKTEDESTYNRLVELFINHMLQQTVRGSTDTSKLVITWDFRSQPYSIGDLILLQQAANCICLAHGITQTRTYLLADRENPARPSFLALGVNGENYLDHIIRLLPVLLLCDEAPALTLEHDEDTALQSMAAPDAAAWPTVPLLKSMLDLNLPTFRLLNMFYDQQKMLPEFRIRGSLARWARNFIEENARGYIPVAVQMRKTKSYNLSRNSNIEAWSEFFSHCHSHLPVKFFVICAASEVDEQLRAHENVVIAKDSRTTVDQDLALIKECAAFMGISSGPATVAFFGNRPYSIVNAHLEQSLVPLLKKEPWGYSFTYAKKNQRIVASGNETCELLVRELGILLKDLTPGGERNIDQIISDKDTDLRLH